MLTSQRGANYTNGEPYLVTQAYDESERGHSVHYLLPDGSRFKVTIDQSDATDEMKHKMGMAFAEGRTNMTKRQ